MAHHRLFHYRLPGSFHAYGPVRAMNAEDARRKIRAAWGLKRLPAGTEVWETTAEEQQWMQQHFEEWRASLRGTGLCVTD